MRENELSISLSPASFSFHLGLILVDLRAMERKKSPHYQLAIMNKVCVTFKPNQWKLTASTEGPVTDYGASIVHWMRQRQAQDTGPSAGEAERPSISYIVDVSTPPRITP